MSHDPDLTKRDALMLALIVVASLMGAALGLIFGCRC